MGRRSRIRELLRQRVGGFVFSGALNGVSHLGRLHPLANPKRHDVELIRNVPYAHDAGRAQLLDIYRPKGAGPSNKAVMYVHGGAFRMLSKETHWMMALAFCKGGYTVFNINYRLAPRDRFPAAIEDACKAAAWVHENAHKYGADPDQLVFAGESAGGNLVTALAIACCYETEEPFARQLVDRGVMPRAVLPACGLLQVTDSERFLNRYPHMHTIMGDRLMEASQAYLPIKAVSSMDLCDPLVFLEKGVQPKHPLPPFFAVVGTKDPLIDDTRRLRRAIEGLGGRCETSIFPGEVHAFHAMVWRRVARNCWRETFDFLRPIVKKAAA